MKTNRGYKRYFIWTISGKWVWLTIFMTLVSFCVAMIRLFINMNNNYDWTFIISILAFLCSMLVTIIIPAFESEKHIKQAYEGKLWKALKIFLEFKDYHMRTNELLRDNKNKYIQLLNEACDLPYTRANLQLDGKPYDEFFNMQGSISITDASIHLWKYPEYSWFLLSQYAASLFKQCSKDQGTLSVDDRYNGAGQTQNSFIDHLNKAYNSAFNYTTFTRVYLISEEDFRANKSMIEQFVAGHTLFGINIYIIDKIKFLEDDQRKQYYQNMISAIHQSKFDELPKEKKYLDTMCYKKFSNPDIFNTYIDSSTNNVEERFLNKRLKEPWNSLVSEIEEIIKNNKSLLFYPTTDNFEYSGNFEHKLNEKKSALIFLKA